MNALQLALLSTLVAAVPCAANAILFQLRSLQVSNPVGMVVNVGGIDYPTGAITFSLDPNRTSFLVYDFSAMAFTTEEHILVTAPILNQLSRPPQAMDIFEQGTFEILDPNTGIPFTPSAGTHQVELRSASQANVTDPIANTTTESKSTFRIKPNITWKQGPNGQLVPEGEIGIEYEVGKTSTTSTCPGGSKAPCQSLDFSGGGTAASVPEPSASALCLGGLVTLVLLRRRHRITRGAD